MGTTLDGTSTWSTPTTTSSASRSSGSTSLRRERAGELARRAAREPGLLGGHPLRRPDRDPHGLADVLVRDGRRGARGARRRAARGPQDDARDRSAAPHGAPQDLLEEVLRPRGRGVRGLHPRRRALASSTGRSPRASSTSSSEISRELPIRFLCSIFTVPQEDAPELIRWGDKMIANQDPDLSAAVADRSTPRRTATCPSAPPLAYEVWAYADRQRESRLGRSRPTT